LTERRVSESGRFLVPWRSRRRFHVALRLVLLLLAWVLALFVLCRAGTARTGSAPGERVGAGGLAVARVLLLSPPKALVQGSAPSGAGRDWVSVGVARVGKVLWARGTSLETVGDIALEPEHAGCLGSGVAHGIDHCVTGNAAEQAPLPLAFGAEPLELGERDPEGSPEWSGQMSGVGFPAFDVRGCWTWKLASVVRCDEFDVYTCTRVRAFYAVGGELEESIDFVDRLVQRGRQSDLDDLALAGVDVGSHELAKRLEVSGGERAGCQACWTVGGASGLSVGTTRAAPAIDEHALISASRAAASSLNGGHGWTGVPGAGSPPGQSQVGVTIAGAGGDQ
jgi:hypothetical protein